MSTERLSAGILSVLLLCLLDAGAAPARLAAQEAAPPSAIDTLRAEVETLERQVELATGKGFYLVLDPRAPGLRLMFEGAVLQQFPVSSIDVGAPRLFFRSPDTIEPWEPSIWGRALWRRCGRFTASFLNHRPRVHLQTTR